MTSRTTIVLAAVLHLLKPVARLLLRHGVAYPAFAAALKQVFLEAAHEELALAGRKRTDSAVSLLSGVHRRDVRTLGRLPPVDRTAERDTPPNVASQVVGRWLSDPRYLDEAGQPRPLSRYGEAPSFDSLVVASSSEFRARAVLAELERLGIAETRDSVVRLREAGFVPRQGFDETVGLLRDNLHDHLAAAAENLDGVRNHLEQAVYVSELTAESAHQLHVVSARAWRQAFRTVMREAQSRYDHDQANAPPEKRTHRARFGSYFYAENDDASNS